MRTHSAPRWTSADGHSTPRRGRRFLTLGPLVGVLPFLAVFALLALRGSVVRIIAEGERASAPAVGTEPSGGRADPQAGSEATTAPAAGPGSGVAVSRPRQQSRTHCTNTCFKAFDGVCDEGRPASPETTAAAGGGSRGQRRSLSQLPGERSGHPGQELGPRRSLAAVEGNAEVSELLCDLGTDCSDCGAWVGTVPEGWDEHDGPVAWARVAYNASLFVRRTTTPRPFLAAIAHHRVDPDVSAMLWHYGAMEGGITRILHHVLNGQCEPAGGQRRRLVLDVGANFGYYAVQAALYGCRVVAFEPVRKFRALLEWTAHAAGVAALLDVSPLALGEAEGPLQLRLPRDGTYWGLASVDGVNLMSNEVRETITVNATTLDRWEVWAPPGARPKDVLLLKMDIEGWEAPVLRGGSKLLAHNVDNVLLEYSPGIYERLNMSHLPPQAALPSSLLALSAAGFALAHLPLFAFAAPWPPMPIDPAQPLPELEEVTPAALRHDLEALEYRGRMEVSPGGCPLPPELTERFGVWRSCREWTYGAHPKGFRSAFGFNTNVWGARRSSEAAKQHMRLAGSAALFDEGQDMKVWSSLRRPGMAMGLVNCSLIGAGHLQLFRCSCPPGAPPACEQERALVAKLAAEGRMPFTGAASAGAGAGAGAAPKRARGVRRSLAVAESRGEGAAARLGAAGSAAGRTGALQSRRDAAADGGVAALR